MTSAISEQSSFITIEDRKMRKVTREDVFVAPIDSDQNQQHL